MVNHIELIPDRVDFRFLQLKHFIIIEWRTSYQKFLNKDFWKNVRISGILFGKLQNTPAISIGKMQNGRANRECGLNFIGHIFYINRTNRYNP